MTPRLDRRGGSRRQEADRKPRRHRLSLLTSTATVLALFPSAAAAAPTTPPPIRQMVGLDQNIGAQLPLETGFINDAGEAVTLRDVIRDRPVVLVFGYFTCPQLCGVTIDGTLDALRQMRPAVGKDYDVVYVSIDPADTPRAAADKKAATARLYGRGPDHSGWHFLIGTSGAIARVTRAAGFRFQPIAGTKQFAHPSGFLVVRPDGVISRYFPGVDFRPAEIAEALNLAAAGKNGTTVYDLLLVCFSGGLRPGASRWAFIAVQIGAGLTVVAMGTGIGLLLRSERKQRRHAREASE